MAEIERMTITLPSDVAAELKDAIEGGEYASSSEIISEALRDWQVKRALHLRELASLKDEIAAGLRDVAEQRVRDFDSGRISERGRALSAGR